MSFDNLIIRASAGTGKTFRLSNRYLGLLADAQNPAQILASTFTRKAAGEILDRIVERLAEATIDDSTCKQLSSFLETDEDLNRESAQKLLGQLLRGLHRVRVSTLDAFFSKLARTFSLDIGLNPGWTVLDSFTESKLKDESIRLALAEQGASKMMHLLAKGEAERSVSVLVRDTINSLHDLYVRTKPEAWDRVKEIKAPTPEAVALAISRLEDMELESDSLNDTKSKDLGKFKQDQWSNFLSTGFGKKVFEGDPRFRSKPLPDSLVREYETLVQHASAKMVNRLVTHTKGTYQLLQSFDVHFQRLKRLQGAYSFNDITRTVAATLRDHPMESLAYRSEDSINHLLLDEFQDTSPDQWNVVRRFAERTVEPIEGRSFFCVGDVKQAIYGWRGGEAKIFDTVNEQLENVQVAPSMNHSRRSSQNVIKTVNQVFELARNHPNLQDDEEAVMRWCNAFEAHTAESKTAGFARLEVTREEQDCFQRSAEIVAELRSKNVPLSIGILVRTNASVARMIHELTRLHIPASEEGGNPLIDSAAVNLVLSVLRWIDHPGDSASFFHFAQSPLGALWKIPNQHLATRQFMNSEEGTKLNQRLRRELIELGYDAAIQNWIEPLWPKCNQRETTRLRQLLDQAGLWNPRMTLRPTDFVNHLQDVKVSDASSDPVRVMNVHQSKGLEFDAVILPELNGRFVGQTEAVLIDAENPSEPPQGVIRYPNKELRSLLPKEVDKWHQQYQSRRVNESLCVLYVALTRAREALYMVVETNPKEKSLPRTFDGLLRATLGGNAIAPSHGITLYASGDPEWLVNEQGHKAASLPESSELDSDRCIPDTTVTQATTHSTPQISWNEAANTTSKAREIISPSSLEGGSRREVADALRPRSNAGSLFGTVIHAWFEQVIWLSGEGVTETTFSQAQRRAIFDRIQRLAGGNTNELKFEDIESYFLRATQNKELQRLLSLDESLQRFEKMKGFSAGGDLRVENERRFLARSPVGKAAGKTGARLMQGSIDRIVWYELQGKPLLAEIIDYKTDRWDSDDLFSLNEKKEYYRPQLDAYRQAVMQLTQLSKEQVLTKLVLLDPFQVVPL